MRGHARWTLASILVLAFGPPDLGRNAEGAVTREEVERAIREGVRYLKSQQRNDGSWSEVDDDARTGTTSLVTLALLTAGETPDSPGVARALAYLRHFDPGNLNSVYAVSLQTMVFAAARPKEDIVRIAANVRWLEEAQLKPGDHAPWPGSWSYKLSKARHGDNSNSQYALLALNAASEVGVPVKAETWQLARNYWRQFQQPDGSWSYTPDANNSTGSMTCAGLSSLIISGLKRYQGQEMLVGENGIENCGKGGSDRNVDLAIRWLAANFRVGENIGDGVAVEVLLPLRPRTRRPALGQSGSSATHDWYREGAEELVHEQDKFLGYWRGTLYEREPLIATSFAAAVPGQGAGAGADQQAPPRPAVADGSTGTTTSTTSATSSASSRATGTTCSPGRSSTRTRRRRGHAPGADRLLQRPRGPDIQRRGEEATPRVRRAGRLHLRRGVLRPKGVRQRVQGT